MPATGTRSSQANSLVLAGAVSDQVRTPQVATFALGSFPAEAVRSSDATTLALVERQTETRSPQLATLVLARGAVFDPSVRAWTFTLDGHDFYVLRLGNAETLVYDMTTDQWYKWANSNNDLWNVNDGTNWIQGQRPGARFGGSNVLVGSDANGALYFLDPEKDTDDSPLGDGTEFPFTRYVIGQVPLRGYDRASVYELQLIGSTGQLSNTSLTAITLSYSDDRGDNFTAAGTVNIPNGDYDARATWRSLGSFASPGRIFRIEDNGALRRIDSLTMNSDLG